MQSSDFSSKKISLRDYPDELFNLGQTALNYYNQVDSYEIWNIESLNGTLRQVEFFHDIGAFKSQEDLLRVYEALEKLFLHLETQAELGYKFNIDDPERKPLAKFHMFFNEVVIGDNSILALLNGRKLCFVTHSGINFMLTHDVSFCDNMYTYYQNLIGKSTLISSVSERERARFFNVLGNRIQLRKKKLTAQ